MPDGLLAVVFVAGSLVSLGSSWLLVSRIERVGARLGFSEALLGMLAALAADTPEITAAITALAGRHARIGAGVVIGSNVFNLAALLGFGAIVAGGIALHRRVIAIEGVVALWIAATCVGVVAGLLPSAVGLVLVLAALLPYLLILGIRHDSLRRLVLPDAWARWLTSAVTQEEIELEVAIHPRRGRATDAIVAAMAVLVVVAASIAMEQSASTLGTRHGVPDIVVGALVLAAVTSLPNAVAAIYLAARGRGAATLSTAMNSNALNVAVGLLIPATVAGLGAPSGQGTLVAVWYLALTAFALGGAYVSSGLRRPHGVLIICGYVAFFVAVLATAYPSDVGVVLGVTSAAALALVLAAWLGRHWGQRKAGAVAGDEPNSGRRLDGAPTKPISLDQLHSNGQRPLRRSHEAMKRGTSEGGDASLIAGWSASGLWLLALGATTTIAAADAVLGHRVILIGLLVVGPCCALLTGRWGATAATGTWAIVLAVVLGFADSIWGSFTHLAFVGAVVFAAVITTCSAAVIELVRQRRSR